LGRVTSSGRRPHDWQLDDRGPLLLANRVGIEALLEDNRARHLLVEQHADQHRERVGVQQRVGSRILYKLKFRHVDSLKP
jgi:hypothetical protein